MAAAGIAAWRTVFFLADGEVDGRDERDLCSCCGNAGFVVCDVCAGEGFVSFEGKMAHDGMKCPKCLGKEYVRCPSCHGHKARGQAKVVAAQMLSSQPGAQPFDPQEVEEQLLKGASPSIVESITD
ncbi:unnamed protein product [Pedinophyceae sp. YPF-701]|nr:unnamed protein product [Pedinophyceae sp. YPF-701]